MNVRQQPRYRFNTAALLCVLAATALTAPATASAEWRILEAPAPTADEGGATASIVGGRAASITEFPSLAYIEARIGKGGFACTGTVVAPRVILTAAHCIESQESGAFTPPGAYAIATSTTAPGQTEPQNIFRVVETHVFPGFDPGSLRGDAGILVLDRPTGAPPLALAGAADAALYAGGASVQLAGWGLTRANAVKAPGSLRATGMTVQTPAFCRRKTRDFYPPYSAAQQLCTLATPAKTSGGCFGDSGGPAIAQRAEATPVQLGIISTGGPFCSTKLPNVLTRTDLVSTWVAEWAAAIEAGGPRPVVDPNSPFPLMTRPVAEAFTVFTLARQFGRRFERTKQVFGNCRRASRSRFRCQVAWRAGRLIFAGIVTPFYVRRQEAFTWDSHFRIEWAAIRCLRSNPGRCAIHTKRG
ncbi:MAG TPA: trypsin-like serine protease [Solirubrobacterales bacterium]|nr:trypsin-like serine protease [Solirubrobacterales bacterium]